MVNAAGHVGPAVRGAGRRRRPAAGRRALLPADRHGAGDGPGPAGHRGPGQLRLLPARGRRHAGRPVRAGRPRPWSLDGVPGEFSFGKLPPDWERMEPYLGPAMDRIPSLAETGRADVLLRAGVVHRRRPAAARARRPSWTATSSRPGLNSLGILSGGGVGSMLAHWIVDGVPPVDATARGHRPDARRTRRPAGSGPSGPWSSSACCSATRSGRPGSRRPRGTCAARCCTTGWPRRAAHFGVSAGWEFAEWFVRAGDRRPAGPARLDCGRPAAHRARRRASTPRSARRSA